MSFNIGHIVDMNNREKERGNRISFQENNRDFMYVKRKKEEVTFWKKQSRRKLSQDAKNKIQTNAEIDRKERMRLKIISVVIAVGVFAGVYFFV